MKSTLSTFVFCLLILFVSPPVSAQDVDVDANSNEPTERDAGDLPPQSVDEELAHFLVEALSARDNLKRQGDSGRIEGEELWAAASNFAEAVQESEGASKQGFLPLLLNLRDALEVGDVENVNVTRTISDLAAIQNSPGIFAGGKDLIDIEVSALQDGEAVDGLYVWIDLACCVRENQSFNPLPAATSPARGAVIPGLYLVRLRDGDETIAQREILIGGTGDSEQIDMVIANDR